MIPTKISLNKDGILYIKWDDGNETNINSKSLRRFCPCATCASLRDTQSKNFIPIFGLDQITIVEINKVGSYAISIKWKDGHSTGIYEFPYLKLISKNNIK